MKRISLIKDIAVQDRFYIGELLLKKRYEALSLNIRVTLKNPDYRLLKIKHILNKINLPNILFRNSTK